MDGRPRIVIDPHQLKEFMRIKPTLADTAAFFDCCEDTIANRIRELFGKTFSEFRQQNMVHTRHDMIRKAMQMGLSGNVPMLIFCLKNQCGWSDKPEEEDKPEEKKDPLVIEI